MTDSENIACMVRRNGARRITVPGRIRSFLFRHSLLLILPITLFAGVAGGFLAACGAFLRPDDPWMATLNILFFSPVIEELLKPSGLIYLMEKQRGLLRKGWQFPLAGACGALSFAVLENLLYQYIYLASLPGENHGDVILFRWVVCTLLHVGCSILFAMGLYRVWKRRRRHFLSRNLLDAWPYFVAAAGLHSLYNFLALTYFEKLLPF